MKKCRLEEMTNPVHLYARFDKEWKVVVKCHRAKGYELKIVNSGKLSKAYLFRFNPLASFCLQK